MKSQQGKMSDSESSSSEDQEIQEMVRKIQAATKRDATEVHLALDAFGFNVDEVIRILSHSA